MRNLILITAYLFFITFCGCKGNDNNEIDYAVSRNDTFSITMTSNISTGYSWYWDDKGRVGVVDSLKREYFDDEEGIGKEGKEVWTFIAKKKGIEKLIFVYKRTYDTTYESKKEFFVKVE